MLLLWWLDKPQIIILHLRHWCQQVIDILHRVFGVVHFGLDVGVSYFAVCVDVFAVVFVASDDVPFSCDASFGGYYFCLGLFSGVEADFPPDVL